ncbi:MAG: D-xylose transport system permease protein [Pseudonocardiales bacterium]|jgi:D-xylose transport system permease protein|nr:inner-rane translocator [Pseudonocardiales bacterium]MDT4961062.1 D-xylose transport system permease protein [Pseudonocardiales bacterium]MDT4970491.1 D-xylose transport system permease protein [Pseudonocardiales bacterium]MDT4978330.1 D-xylose transport system permease protein [Pseudonocardiales bacterium]
MTTPTPESGSPTPEPAVATETSARTGNQPGSFSLDVERRGLTDAFRDYINRIRSGDPGALPSVLGVVVLVIIFSQVSSRFLSRTNIGNLPGQGAYIAVIAMGLIFVLLIGEIDLSAGTAGGVCAAIAAQSLFSHGLHHGIPGVLYAFVIAVLIAAALLGLYLRLYAAAAFVVLGIVLILIGATEHYNTTTGTGSAIIWALLISVSVGTAIGIFTGWLVARVGIPSFVVTLALFLAWQGVVLFLLGSQPINVSQYSLWNGLANNNMSPTWSWVYVLVLVGGYFAYTLTRALRAQAKGLAGDAISLVLIRAGVIAVIAIVIVVLANQNRNPSGQKINEGLPWAVSISVALMIACTIGLSKTTWGRHLFAIGGNAEAARRAGIDVTKMKISAFVMCSTFAALGGAFLASQQGSVTLDMGAGNILLFSVAAAVIGGTSLFGGRGKPRDALIGALVIVIIPNGLQLRPSLPAQYQQVITGVVLLLAAAVDALSRRRALRN